MEKYKFPLQKLLNIRIDKEDESKRDFVESQRQKNIVEENVNMLKFNYKKYNIKNNDETIALKKIRDIYLTTLNDHILKGEDELEQKKEAVEIQRIDLKQKQIERKTVEILGDKCFAAYNKEINRIEQKENDEFALYAFVRGLERR